MQNDKDRWYEVGVLVDPKMAQQFLNTNIDKQRNQKKKEIAKYKKRMRLGEWCPNGEVLKFDTNKQLIDGQNRLCAVIKTGLTIEFDIAHNINPEYFDTLDNGSTRGGIDVLTINKEKNCGVLSAAIDSCLLYYRRTRSGDISIPIVNKDRTKFLELNPDIRKSVDFIQKNGKELSLFSGKALFTGFHFIFSQFDQKLADDFILSIAYGTNLYKNSPIILLRDRLLKDKLSQTKLKPIHKKALLVLTWNAYISSKTARILQWRKDSDKRRTFPEVLNDPRTIYVE